MERDRRRTSGELIEAAGCTRKALRVYRARGLIGPGGASAPARWDDAALRRLRLIAVLRRLGLSLDDIAALLRPRDAAAESGPIARQMAERMGALVRRANAAVEQAAEHRARVALARETLAACSSCRNPLERCRQCGVLGRLDEISRVLLADVVRSAPSPPG